MDLSSDPRGRLGILGGTFDPIHVGHLLAASEAMHHFQLGRVILVPTGRPWQKLRYSDPEDRLMMTTLAAATHPRLSVSRIEIDRRGSTYTVDTLEELHRFFPESELFFIVGADAALELETWHRVSDIPPLATIIAVTRPGADLSILPTRKDLPTVRTMEMPALAVSSTDIRRRVAVGAPIDYLAPPEVIRYIRDRGLYVTSEEVLGA